MKVNLRKVALIAALLSVLTTGLVASPSVAGGTDNQGAHTLNLNDKGSDVMTVQWLLTAHGVPTAVDGSFGATTRTNVMTFQGRVGLTRDGIVGPLTWSKVVKVVKAGAGANEVKAVQHQLNAKASAGLALDGQYGSATATAVRSFQSSHNLTVDGVVGPATWNRLVGHFGVPNLAGPNLCGYASTSRQAGTASAISGLDWAARRVAGSYGQVALGELSLPHGGDISGHDSHEVGLDADVRPMRKNNDQCAGGTTWDSASYDQAATRALINALYATGQIKLILFNDPAFVNAGLTIRWPNHDNHLHVRFVEKGFTHEGISYTK